MANEEWNDFEFEVALDSGAVIHVCSPSDCPGYTLEESPGSKRGQFFFLATAGRSRTSARSRSTSCDSEGIDVRSIFQIAAVTRPLMSVGRICDEGQ